jgi:hypothetical protein
MALAPRTRIAIVAGASLPAACQHTVTFAPAQARLEAAHPASSCPPADFAAADVHDTDGGFAPSAARWVDWPTPTLR